MAREKVAAFTGSTAGETIFTKNVTEAINLVSYSWGRTNVGPDDLVVLTQMEHHSNIVPWHILGSRLAWVPITDEGLLDLDVLDELLAQGPKLVAVAHISNVLGTISAIGLIVPSTLETCPTATSFGPCASSSSSTSRSSRPSSVTGT